MGLDVVPGRVPVVLLERHSAPSLHSSGRKAPTGSVRRFSGRDQAYMSYGHHRVFVEAMATLDTAGSSGTRLEHRGRQVDESGARHGLKGGWDMTQDLHPGQGGSVLAAI